ncbi:hypothetical protein H9P43_008322 [Blastocladiella emersonii ATCC 22665]|nr:hypothetical protein H9P43_008322 [Blastocladiella emersonii ATCC 22665]
MSSILSKSADWLQRGLVAGLATVTVLGIVGTYQASSARIELARTVKEKIQKREQELIAERIAREQAEAAAGAAASTTSASA